jgi:uncharacterized protein (TIGR04255 family)
MMASPARPADLPDYTSPPVTEVALGVQFNTIGGFLSPHLGIVWEQFKDEFPTIEERPPIPASFETFGQNPAMPALEFQLFAAPMPRVLFIKRDNTQLLQVQRDRFVHNWRKIGEGDKYPRFERMIETFRASFQRLIDVIDSLGYGPVTPNQCETTYINQIPMKSGEGASDAFERLFGHFNMPVELDELQRPEDGRFSLRYVIRTRDSTPIGRLHIAAEPALRADGVPIVQLSLVARGRPAPADVNGAVEFLTLGRHYIVRTFSKITSPQMQKVWGRTQ